MPAIRTAATNPEFARISNQELRELFKRYGYGPYLVEGDDSDEIHQQLASALDQALSDIHAIRSEALRNCR